MSKLADPKILMAIKNLRLRAKTTVEGFMNGINRSTLKGQGIEFSQYRSYQPGDDLRRLDWKLVARSDRYYIRESEEETDITIRLLVDASASMQHTDGGFTKMDYAKLLAASIAYLADIQHDVYGLTVFQNGSQQTFAPGKDRQHFARMISRLENIVPSGKFVRQLPVAELFPQKRSRELVILITDLHEQDHEIFDALSALAALKHEVIVFQLMGSNELDFDYHGYGALEDLETGDVVKIDPSQALAYTTRLRDHLAALRMQLLGKNISYQLVSMQQPVETALRAFLNQRNKLK